MTKRNINKWLKWYKNLCLEIDILPHTKEKVKRYYATAWALHQRAIFNPKTATKSSLWANSYLEKGKELEGKIKDLECWFEPQKDKRKKPKLAFRHIDFGEWNIIEQLRSVHLSVNIDNLNKKIEASITDEKTILENKLKELSNCNLFYLEYFEAGKPLQNENFDLFKLVCDIDVIDFENYIIDLLNPENKEADTPAQNDEADTPAKIEKADTPAQNDEADTPAQNDETELEMFDRVGLAYKLGVWEKIRDKSETRTHAFIQLAKITGASVHSVGCIIRALEGRSKTHLEYQRYSEERLNIYRNKAV